MGRKIILEKKRMKENDKNESRRKGKKKVHMGAKIVPIKERKKMTTMKVGKIKNKVICVTWAHK
jgi:hypothetical protein